MIGGMSSWHDALPPSPHLDALVELVENDPNVLGVLAVGSWAHGMTTEHSDLDLVLVLERAEISARRRLEDRLDVSGLGIDRLRRIPRDPSRWWDRYRYARARVLLDRTGGEIQEYVDAHRVLDTDEVADYIDMHLDGYLAFVSRSLMGHREGRERSARLDAAESLPWLVPLLFAVHGRVRPLNKYLAWELDREPFTSAGWEPDVILGAVDRLLDGSADAQRELFALLEPKLRERGFGGALDHFEPGIDLLRSDAWGDGGD